MNSTDRDISANCSLFIDNQLAEERKLILEHKNSNTFSFEYPVKNIPPGIGEDEVGIKFVVESSEYSDAIEFSLPVKERYLSITKEKTIPLKGEASFDFESNEYGTITITTDINEILFKSISYLLRYPYGCVEQTMSTWLPVIAAKNLENILTVDIKDELAEYNAEALERLYGYQHYDGGWGWWKNDSTDSFMTAYVMYGFYLADKAGMELNNDVVENGIRILGYMMNNNRDPFVQYVYTLYNDSPDLIIQKYDSDLASVALTSLALHKTGKKQEAIKFLEKAWDFIKLGEENVEVNGKSFNYFFDSDMSLLMLFKAMNELDYDNELSLRVGQAILNKNQGGRWRRTISTCFAVIELSDFSKNLSEDVEVFVRDNSKLIKHGFLDENSVIEIKIYPEIEVPITINTTGNVFVIINIDEKYPMDSVEPMENGMKVERILRKEVEILSRNAYISRTIPQIDSPYIIGQLEQIELKENEEISINTRTEYNGMELHFFDNELYLGEYRLGWKSSNTELLGKIGKSEFLLRKELYNDRLKFIKLVLVENTPLKVGDIIIAESDIEFNKDIKYLIFEEPVPSAALYIDEYKLPDGGNYSTGKYSGSYRTTYSHIEPRYEKVSYFWRNPSDRVIRTAYRLIATGEYIIPPSKVWGMYDEESFGTSGSTILEIQDRE
jgi:hypothetical protein